MASAITHFVVGAALALPAVKSRAIRSVLPRWAIPVTSGLLAVAPDLDTWAMQVFEIPHGSFLGHRGFFHSPFFLVLLAAARPAKNYTRPGQNTGGVRPLGTWTPRRIAAEGCPPQC
ncbi:MAG: metal-dependent hydrolase [Acidobacteriia bacterium]|nr:metal-dependent hydrolase [Terriglobia bacterium]